MEQAFCTKSATQIGRLQGGGISLEHLCPWVWRGPPNKQGQGKGRDSSQESLQKALVQSVAASPRGTGSCTQSLRCSLAWPGQGIPQHQAAVQEPN